MGGIVERLLGFLETGRDFVTAEAVIQLKDLLRRYPAIAEASLSSVSSITPEAIVWPPLRQPLQELPGLRDLGASTPEQSPRMAAAQRSIKTQEDCLWPCLPMEEAGGLRCLGALCRTLWSLKREQPLCGFWASMGRIFRYLLSPALSLHIISCLPLHAQSTAKPPSGR